MLTLIVVGLIYWKSNRLLLNGSKIEKKNQMTSFPLHTSGIETQSSGKDVITQCLSNSGWTISISHNLEIFSYICIVLYINQLKLLNESVKNPNP